MSINSHKWIFDDTEILQYSLIGMISRYKQVNW